MNDDNPFSRQIEAHLEDKRANLSKVEADEKARKEKTNQLADQFSAISKPALERAQAALQAKDLKIDLMKVMSVGGSRPTYMTFWVTPVNASGRNGNRKTGAYTVGYTPAGDPIMGRKKEAVSSERATDLRTKVGFSGNELGQMDVEKVIALAIDEWFGKL